MNSGTHRKTRVERAPRTILGSAPHRRLSRSAPMEPSVNGNRWKGARSVRQRAGLIAVMAGVTIVAACGATDPGPAATATGAPAPSTTSTTNGTGTVSRGTASTGEPAPPSSDQATATPVKVTFTDKRFWHIADTALLFQIDLTSAELTPIAGSAKQNLTINATVKNLTENPVGFGDSLSMTAAGQRYDLRCTTTATVPGGESSPMTCKATGLPTGFNIDDAVVTAGDAQSNQSVVPLKAGVTPTSFEPIVDVANGKSFTAGTGGGSTGTVTRSILYQDYTRGKKDEYRVEMRFAFVVAPIPGGEEIDSVTLVAPDGTSSKGTEQASVFHHSDHFIGDNGAHLEPVQTWTIKAPVKGHYKITTVSRTVRLGKPGTDGGFEFDIA